MLSGAWRLSTFYKRLHGHHSVTASCFMHGAYDCRGDLLDGALVSWVPWCYCFYTPAVSNLARFVWRTAQPLDADADAGAAAQKQPDTHTGSPP